MSYKVDFDSLDSMANSVQKQTDTWLAELDAIKGKMQVLIDSRNMSGAAADNVKCYIETVHMTLIGLLSQLIYLHSSNCWVYKYDYQSNIDTGLHSVIKSSELLNFKGRIDATKATAISIDDAIAYVLRGINDIFHVSYANVTAVDVQHTSVSKYLLKLDEKIKNLEETHYNNDFVNTGDMLTSLRTIINEQLAESRTYRTDFAIDELRTPSWQVLIEAHTNVTGEIEQKDSVLQEAIKNEEERLKAFEQEKEDREWIKWVAVGIAVVGSVVLIAVTAGGATPLVCAGVGAAVGVTTAAANNFADNYIEKGSLTEGMDWSKMGKDCLIGAATGAITGYMGASSVGSALKQPIDKALYQVAGSVVGNAAEGVIDIAWDFGEGVIMDKPGDEILSVLEENTKEMFKEIVTEGAEEFAGGFISGKFDVDPAQKGFWKKFGEDTVENAGKAFAKNSTESLWDIGDAVLDPNSSENFTTILKKEGTDFASGFAKDFVEGEIEAVAGGANKAYQNSHKDQSDTSKILGSIFSDTVGEAAGGFAGGAVDQGVELAFGQREKFDVKEIWDEEMDSGRIFIKAAGESAGKHISESVFEDKEFQNQLKKKDYDNDGKVDVVVFDKYMVLKEDYEAARALSGKGAYKDMSAQDILGLPKNVAISEKNVEVKQISIKRLEESEFKGRKETNVTKIDNKSDAKKIYKK